MSSEKISPRGNAPSEKTTGERVLVVDDDVRVVELLQITLGGRGYEVRIALDGESAWQSIEAVRPDLVVLDVRLPKKNGLEVLQQIRQSDQTSDLPVILISANAATESRLQGLKLGADDYLTKPFSPRELMLRIRRILDRSHDRSLLRSRNEVLEREVRRSRDTLHQMQMEMAENLNHIGGLVTRVLELHEPATVEQVLERFVVTAVQGLEFERVALLVGGGRELCVQVARGVPDSALPGLRLAGNGAFVQLVRKVGRPVPLAELEEFPEVRDELGRFAAAGISLIVPAFHGPDVAALLALGDRAHTRALVRHEMKVLEILGQSVATALRNSEAFASSQRTFFETTAHLVTGIEDRFPYMRGHSERVCRIALAMGERLGLSEAEREALRWGALLHDLGELERYAELLQSTRVLTDEERQELRQEAAIRGGEMLGERGYSRVREILRHHQERWDGTGEPDRFRGLEIPLGARIVALANCWDALIHDRPHRPAYGAHEARQLIESRSGTHFDPELVPLLFLATDRLESLLASA